MSDTRQQESKTPAQAERVEEEAQPKELTKEQESKVKGGLNRSLEGNWGN